MYIALNSTGTTNFDPRPAVYNLQTDSSSDHVCSVNAKSLLDFLSSERFILTRLIFKKIFDLVSPLSKFWQEKI